jgi:cell division protein FtsB
MPPRGRASRGRAVGVKVALAVAIGGAAWFAVQGGEYSTFDLLDQRTQRARLESEVAALQQTVDSLQAWRKAIETDPAVQEQIARESFGMVRGDKELLYRFADQ